MGIIVRFFQNKYGLNILPGLLVFLLFLPTTLIKDLADWTMLYGLIGIFLYPIYLSIANYFKFRQISSKNYLSNIYVVFLGTIINLGFCIPIMINSFVIRGPEILMIFVLFIISILLTIIGSLFTFFGIKSYEKMGSEMKTYKQDDLICISTGSLTTITRQNELLISNGINCTTKENTILNFFELYIEKRNEKESLKILNE